ncbi:uncharacterized protein [Littorina saxatilis]|uniref:Uncharacterized protein n=1 Tax=Littorina saxatilis TaxID=31220 RepID=A0AAN9BQB5_9CAEN
MRLFQQQTVYNTVDNTEQAPPPPPPFLTDEKEEESLCLLRESTTHLREGSQRLPTPDRVAIMELSSSFKKRRLGKQQQILSEITQRCREQEVTDLSSKISNKVNLKKTDHEGHDSPPFHRTTRRKRSKGSLSTGDLRDLEALEGKVNFEKTYKFFPARKIMRQPSRLQLFQTAVTKSGGGGGPTTTATASGGGLTLGGGSNTYRETTTASTGMPTTRININFLKGTRSNDPEYRAQILERQNINGTIQLQHYIEPKLDAMAPLLLPDVHAMDGGYQDRIDSYFSSSRLSLNQRSRSFYDTSSVSGRSFKSLHTGSRPAGSRHQLKSMRSERGPHDIPREVDDGVDGGLRLATRGTAITAGSREMPMSDLKSSASALRPESQRV